MGLHTLTILNHHGTSEKLSGKFKFTYYGWIVVHIIETVEKYIP